LNVDAGQQVAIASIMRRGSTDDRANAVAGVVVGLAMERTEETITASDVPIPYRKSIWSAFDTTR
jgi:hypothetical protein